MKKNKKAKNPPALDWQLALKVVNGNKAIATEILTLLAKVLPKDMAEMKRFHQEKNTTQLIARAHKLRGALCYCGTPRLKALLGTLEQNLTEDELNFNPTPLMEQIDEEVKQVLADLKMLDLPQS